MKTSDAALVAVGLAGAAYLGSRVFPASPASEAVTPSISHSLEQYRLPTITSTLGSIGSTLASIPSAIPAVADVLNASPSLALPAVAPAILAFNPVLAGSVAGQYAGQAVAPIVTTALNQAYTTVTAPGVAPYWDLVKNSALGVFSVPATLGYQAGQTIGGWFN